MKSLAKYLLHGSNNESPNRGKVLATNFAGSDIRSWSREFAEFRRLKPNLTRAVTHISLNVAPDDRHVTDEEFVEIAKRFKAGLGYTDDCPFLLVRHSDKHQHVHLMLSRISLNGVVPETNDFRKAEKLAVALRKEFRLKGPADKKKNEENDKMDKQSMEERRTAAIVTRLEDAAQDTEANLASAAEPDAPSIEPVGPMTVKVSRDMRREIQTAEYQRALNELFLEQLRYLRKSSKALTLYFKDGGRVYDAGDRVTVYSTPDPSVAASRLIEVAAMKGWDNGFVIRGSDELLRHAAMLAVQRGLPIVALDDHQFAIIQSVRKQLSLTAGESIGEAPASLPKPENPLRQMSGARRFGERLEERREDVTSSDEDVGIPTHRPFGMRGRRP